LGYAVEMRGITKRFSKVLANDHIDLLVKRQEIHCLLGENGSGKTTLMNVLFGIYDMDEGEILIEGKPVQIHSPKDASDLGIGMVHQHFMLFNQFSVLENIILGDERTPLFLDYEKNRANVEELLKKYDFHLDLDEKVGNLSIGMKQRVEIVKVLYRGADIIIFDEPTSVLTPQESDTLMQMILNLREQGKTIIYISHKLGETMSIGDVITVLRKGAVVANVNRTDTTPEELACYMVGKEVNTRLERKQIPPGKTVFEIRDVPIWPERKPSSIQVREHEILGIAGVDGNGQMELEQIIMGLMKQKSGDIYLNGKIINEEGTLSRKMSGIAYVPSNRHKFAMLPNKSLRLNYLLGNQNREDFKKHGLIQNKQLDSFAKSLIKTYDVKTAGIEQTIGSLSGGNQQKLVLSREMSQAPKFILAAQPTMGLDIGAIEFIHNLLLKKREEGAAILLISADLSEVITLSDRIAVIYEGEIVATKATSEFTREELGILMAGQKKEGLQ
jgi:ABC-type uncharacterized transport system ATPase subunit